MTASRAMDALQAALGHANTVMLAAILAGLIARRRVRLWYTFALLVAAVLVPAVLTILWPARFFRWSFWQAKETAHHVIRFAMAVELAFRTFRAFPGALVTARRVLLMVLVLTWIAVMAVPVVVATDPANEVLALVAELQPRVVNGTVWLFTAIAALILWYRLPVHPFHKAVLLGYVPYLVVFTIVLNALGSLGWERIALLSYVSQVSYLALVTYWAHAVWRTYPAEVASPAEKRRVAQTA